MPQINKTSSSSSYPTPPLTTEERKFAFQVNPTEQTLRNLIDQINNSSDPKAHIVDLVEYINDKKLFECCSKSEVFALIAPWVKEREILKSAGRELFLPAEPQNALWLGIYLGDIIFAEEALAQGASINTPLYSGMSALLLACKRGNCRMIARFLDLGAEVQFIGGTHEHETPLNQARLQPQSIGAFLLRKLEDLDNGFTDEFQARKRLAHQYSAVLGAWNHNKTTFPFTSIHYEGGRLNLINNLKANREFYQHFQQQLRAGTYLLDSTLSAETKDRLNDPIVRKNICMAINEMLSAIEHAYDCERKGMHGNPEEMEADILNRLAEEKGVVCFGITRVRERWVTGAPNSHAWGVIIAKDPNSTGYIVQRCNRGYGADLGEGIVKVNMSYEKVVELIQIYVRALKWKGDVFDKEEATSLIENLIKKGEDQRVIRQKKQRAGTCCYSSAQSIERAFLSGILEPFVDPTDLVLLTKKIHSERTAFARNQAIRAYLDKHNQPETPITPDVHLLYCIASKKEKLKIPNHEMIVSSVETVADEHAEEHALHALWNALILHPGFPQKKMGTEEIRSFLENEENQPLLHTIEKLNFSNQFLGTLPKEINRLPRLVTLTAMNSHLKSIPPLFLPHLKSLFLSNNHLQTLPPLDLPELNTLLLTNNQLITLPSDLVLESLETLNLTSNGIAELSSLHFPRLKSLSLNNNRLTYFPLSHSLDSLLNLDLSNNEIAELPPLQCPQLQRLEISYNRLSNFPPSLPINSIKELDLSSNAIIELPPLHFPKLKMLALNENQLVYFPAEHSLDSLVNLNLSNNAIVELPSLRCPQLTILDLNNNQIMALSSDLTLNSLEELDLSFNPISQLPPISFPKLNRLDMKGNHFQSISTISAPSVKKKPSFVAELIDCCFSNIEGKTPDEETLALLIKLFTELPNPHFQMLTLEILHRNQSITKETLELFFNTINIEAIHDTLTADPHDEYLLSFFFELWLFPKDSRFPNPNEDQIHILFFAIRDANFSFQQLIFNRLWQEGSRLQSLTEQFYDYFSPEEKKTYPFSAYKESLEKNASSSS